jgi:hypothetical protein
MKFFLAWAAALFATFILGFSGCTTFDSEWGDSARNARTNSISVSSGPVYQVAAPTLAQLAQTYRSQDKTFHSSMIQIFSDGAFVWNSITTTAQTFRGQIYDLDSDGFAVKLSDGSGNSFHFQFTPDKRGFWSLDENGTQVEEYLP